MKRITRFLFLPLAIALMTLASCGDETRTGGNALIQGKLSNCSGDTIYLLDISKNPPFPVIDSVVAGDDGSFDFHPTLAYKGFYNIRVGQTEQQFAMLIVKPGDTVTVNGDAKNLGYSYKAENSPESARMIRINSYIATLSKKREPLMYRLDSIQKTFQVLVSMLKKEDSTKVDSLDKVFGKIYEETQASLATIEEEGTVYVRNFIDEQPASFANIPSLRMLEPFDNFDYYEKVILALEKENKDAPNVRLMRDFIERERPHCKGQIPPEIMLNDPMGQPIKLSSLRGKVVLIDFWASWCAPCRAELPNVVNNYKKYHDKGFEVYSVSLDSDKKAWLDAIKQDGLIWPYHVSDLMQWQSSVVATYRIKGIPKTVLLDREGRIIDRDLRGEFLSNTLEQVFSDSTSSSK